MAAHAAAVDAELEAEAAAATAASEQFLGETVSRASYQRPAADVYRENRRAIKPKRLCDFAGFPGADEIVAKNVYDDVATTIYTDAIEKGSNQFPVTEQGSASGHFGKSTHFTNDIHDPTKVHDDPTRDNESIMS